MTRENARVSALPSPLHHSHAKAGAAGGAASGAALGLTSGAVAGAALTTVNPDEPSSGSASAARIRFLRASADEVAAAGVGAAGLLAHFDVCRVLISHATFSRRRGSCRCRCSSQPSAVLSYAQLVTTGGPKPGPESPRSQAQGVQEPYGRWPDARLVGAIDSIDHVNGMSSTANVKIVTACHELEAPRYMDEAPLVRDRWARPSGVPQATAGGHRHSLPGRQRESREACPICGLLGCGSSLPVRVVPAVGIASC